MNIVKQLPAYLLGLPFFIFGIVYFLHLMPEQPMSGDAGTFATLLTSTGYMTVVKVLEVIFGAMLLIPRTRTLAFILIAPIVVNIFLFEICIAHKPGIGVVMLILNAIGIYLNKDKYMGIIQ